MANLYYIQVTRKCNQRCRFCSNPPNENMLSLEAGKKMIDYYVKRGCDGIFFTGGEPTLSPHLMDFMKYAGQKKVHFRIVSNGQKLADPEYTRSLIDLGLRHLHISIYSVREEVHDFLTRTPGSLKNALKALENLGRIGGITVDLNMVINHYNAGHLLENVKFFVEKFPFVRHFVWNNLDPSTTRARRNKDTRPTLNQMEWSLYQAMVYLTGQGRTFRVERIPLCYLNGFEHTAAETRKIVKQEDRSTYFLDKRGILEEKDWLNKWGYSKGECCDFCSLKTICPGLFHKDVYYSSKELYPVFIDKAPIIRRILYEK
ncbi:MAG: radical SAM protein [Candidatus Omnitrophica bacterium]|nr:radical SAM protein [Candidatus Omnitrophota bacterium]MDD5654071.1 radical SAM protein [Candidatus Omnitrophota bacterium]